MVFWAIAATIALVVLFAVFWPMLRRPEAARVPEVNPDLQIYRDQLSEVESDLAKAVLSKEEAKIARLEVSRRLLEADRLAPSGSERSESPLVLTRATAVVVALAMLTATGSIYIAIGANGAPDLPQAKRDAELERALAMRPSQASVEAEIGDMSGLAAPAEQSYIDLVDELRTTAQARPDDLRGQRLLVQHEARLGYFVAAHHAQAKVIALLAADAAASDFTDLAELMIIAAGGYVSPEAERALGVAVRLEPTNARTRYYSGLDLAQNGRPDIAYSLWTDLLAEGPDNAPWIGPIKAQIGDVARLAGKPAPDFAASLPGPSAAEIEDAEALEADERQAMIENMVSQLSDRLASEGGTASEWARLIRAHAVLGNKEQAMQIWTEAKDVFASDADGMTTLSEAANDAGIAE